MIKKKLNWMEGIWENYSKHKRRRGGTGLALARVKKFWVF